MTPIQANTQVLIALFKSTVEQSTALTKEYKQKAKMEFNIWQQQGFKLLAELEKQNQVNEEYVNNITDIYHNINLEIKSNLTKINLENQK